MKDIEDYFDADGLYNIEVGNEYDIDDINQIAELNNLTIVNDGLSIELKDTEKILYEFKAVKKDKSRELVYICTKIP